MSKRPKYINLVQIKLPMPGIISIMHRVSGAVLFFALPVLLYIFQQSLVSFGAFNDLRMFFANWLVKLIVLALIWAYLHHLCAGLRHLYMDARHAVSKEFGKSSAMVTLVISLGLTVVLGAKLFGLY